MGSNKVRGGCLGGGREAVRGSVTVRVEEPQCLDFSGEARDFDGTGVEEVK